MSRPTIDLSIGNPIFMQRYWDSDTKITPPLFVAPGALLSYQIGQFKPLTQQIAELHKIVGNANVENKRIVVGNGATQMLCAALFALREKHGVKRVYAQPPYWFRIPRIIHTSGMQALKGPARHSAEIVTFPSNPENAIRPNHNFKFKIHDMCYHWPQYIQTAQWDFDTMIFGLAKATGHAGSRIGWAVIKDLDIADLMEEYIEITTGGVSMEAQCRATGILAGQAMAVLQMQPSAFGFGSVVLSSRWNIIKGFAQGRFEVLNESGMFMWCRRNSGNAKLWLLNKFGILALSGAECGMGENYFRLNIGCSDEDFAELHSRFTSINNDFPEET